MSYTSMPYNTTVPDQTKNSTEYTPYQFVPRVWPLWLEISVPILCIVLFVTTLIIIFYKPSKPGDKPLFYIPLTRKSNRKKTAHDKDKELQVIRTTDKCDEDDAQERNNIVV